MRGELSLEHRSPTHLLPATSLFTVLGEVASDRAGAGLRWRAAPRLELGPLSLDPATHEVSKDGQPVELSAREFALLHALMENPGVPLSRTQLEERLYGWDAEVASNAVEVHIHALRRKLGAEWIKNVRGVGYRVPAEA